jgi:CBF1 interacting corepressor
MVAGLKFLSKKSFNPQNLTNQKSVWEREQEHKREVARIRERERQMTIERDHEELARSREGASGGQKATLRFMYDAPPGLQQSQSSKHGHDHVVDEDGNADWNHKVHHGESSRDEEFLFQRKSGDDDAAAAFRRMLAGAVSSSVVPGNEDIDEPKEENSLSNLRNEESVRNDDRNMTTSSLIISGSTAEAGSIDKSQLTQLEKAVGKKNGTSALTYQEQIARFPQLKNAPVALKQKGGKSGATNNDECIQTHLNFKPLGAQIRNVRCMACKIWGHSKGDRECKLSGWDPFSLTSSSAAAACNQFNGNEFLDAKNYGQSRSSSCTTKEDRIADIHPKDQRENRTNHDNDDDDDENDDNDSVEKRSKHKKKRKRYEKESSTRTRSGSDDYKKTKRRKKKSHGREKCRSYDYSDDESLSDSDSRRRRHKRRKRHHKSHRRDHRTRSLSRSPSSTSETT